MEATIDQGNFLQKSARFCYNFKSDFLIRVCFINCLVGWGNLLSFFGLKLFEYWRIMIYFCINMRLSENGLFDTIIERFDYMAMELS